MTELKQSILRLESIIFIMVLSILIKNIRHELTYIYKLDSI